MIFQRRLVMTAGAVLVFVGAAMAREEDTNVFGVAQPISASLMGRSTT